MQRWHLNGKLILCHKCKHIFVSMLILYMVSEVSHVTGCESKFALVRRDHPILGADISRFSDETVYTFSFFGQSHLTQETSSKFRWTWKLLEAGQQRWTLGNHQISHGNHFDIVTTWWLTSQGIRDVSVTEFMRKCWRFPSMGLPPIHPDFP